jgi:hypothetical protein
MRAPEAYPVRLRSLPNRCGLVRLPAGAGPVPDRTGAQAGSHATPTAIGWVCPQLLDMTAAGRRGTDGARTVRDPPSITDATG